MKSTWRTRPVNRFTLLLAACATFLLLTGCPNKPKQQAVAPPPPEVRVTKVIHKTIPIIMEFSGTVKAVKTVDIIPRVSGYIDKRHFVEGSYVQAEDPLYLIDPKPFQARLKAAQAQLEKDTASLAFWKNEEARYTRLAKQGAASVEDKEKAITKHAETQAAIDRDKADIESIKLELGYTNITAPFTGRIQETRINVGELVHEQQSVLTTLVQVDPIYVIFNISRAQGFEIQRLQRQGLAPYELEKFQVTVLLPDGSEYAQQGVLNYISAEVNPTTDTLQARAVFQNPHKEGREIDLVSGQYVPLRLTAGHQPDALLIPQAALVDSQAGTHVYVVDKDKQVEMRRVRIGASYQQQWVIKEGLKEGERVIIEGLQKVKTGAVVKLEDSSEKST